MKSMDNNVKETRFTSKENNIESEQNTLPYPNTNFFVKDDNLLFLQDMIEQGRENFIKLIYIDPPFTTKNHFSNKKGEYAYSDVLSDDEFLAFISERVVLARKLLREDGFFFLHIDNKIGHYVKVLLDECFGKENFVTNIITARVKKNNTNSFNFNEAFDHLFVYRKSDKAVLNQIFKESDKKPYWHSLEASGQGEGKFFNGVFIEPSQGNHFRWSQKRIDEELEKGNLRLNKKGRPKYLVTPKPIKIGNNWLDIPGYSFKHHYPTEKSEKVIERVILSASNENDIILDFFAGSGVFLDVGLKLNRNVIGCDKGELSFKTIKNRLKDKIQFFDNMNKD